MLSRIFLIALLCLSFSGCASVQATRGPEQKDLSVFTVGNYRDFVIAEMGAPTYTDMDEDGNKYDIFTFRQGQHGAVKAGKAVGYGLLAFATLGISEVVTSPLEGSQKGAEIKIKTTYDNVNQVKVITVMQDDRWVPIQDLESARSTSGNTTSKL